MGRVRLCLARLAVICTIAGSAMAGAALAQQEDAAQGTGAAFWVQIEAQPSLVEAQERLRDYARTLDDLNGFTLGGGWYAIALGPYAEEVARETLRSLRRDGRVPRDSYVTGSGTYGQQFWPIGATSLTQAVPRAPAPSAVTQVPDPSQPDTTDATPSLAADPERDPTPEITAETPPPAADETPRAARASEATLTRPERDALQIALQWAGYYTAAIDGSFGAGTRAAMAAWQSDNGFEATGVLTTRQRAALLRQYNAVLDGVGLARRFDKRMGIEMLVPMGLVTFEAIEAPFARYAERDGSGVQLIQISRPGDQTSLFGLYDILQTLDIVPPDGDRERRATGFSITGENSRIISQTEVTLRDGAIKGYILVWPRGDEARRQRVLQEIAASFRPVDGVLPLDAGQPDTQSIDLVSGLQVRTPLRARSGVFIEQTGTVLTAAEAVAGCGRVTLDGIHAAEIVAENALLGVALLRPATPLAPPAIARLSTETVRLQSEIAVSGYSFEGVLGAPTLTFGTVADIKGLRGEAALDRLTLAALPGDVGGPVFDMTGTVIGVLQPRDFAGRQLPDDVAFSADAAALGDWLVASGVRLPRGGTPSGLTPEALTRQATAMTVLVSCWE